MANFSGESELADCSLDIPSPPIPRLYILGLAQTLHVFLDILPQVNLRWSVSLHRHMEELQRNFLVFSCFCLRSVGHVLRWLYVKKWRRLHENTKMELLTVKPGGWPKEVVIKIWVFWTQDTPDNNAVRDTTVLFTKAVKHMKKKWSWFKCHKNEQMIWMTFYSKCSDVTCGLRVSVS